MGSHGKLEPLRLTFSAAFAFHSSEFPNKFAGLTDIDLFAWLIISCLQKNLKSKPFKL
jgi:hypothetical protein